MSANNFVGHSLKPYIYIVNAREDAKFLSLEVAGSQIRIQMVEVKKEKKSQKEGVNHFGIWMA